ncbi:MAG: invasion associated locus B family protein [Bauldia sp.]|nr:invasion associated locus B family protein [Bauldia sp.]
MKLAILAATAVAVACLATGASAQSPSNIGVFKDWNAFASNEPDGKVCFIASQPTDSKYSQTVSGRDPAFFQITTIPAKGIRNEASTIVGYTILTSADVTVDVDGTKFKMFLDASHPDTAWAVPDQEAALIEAMKKGTKMTVTGTSSPRKTVVSDSFSLSGITAALDKIAKECP